MNRYIKIAGHGNWFLVCTKDSPISDEFNKRMKETLFHNEVQGGLHAVVDKGDLLYRAKLIGCHNLDYNNIVEKYGVHFPIDKFSEIVICENDKKADPNWVKYLEERFGNQDITVISNFFLRSDIEISEYFNRAKYITFSTTFTDFGWFEKLCKHTNPDHKIIGYCNDVSKWSRALEINNNVEIILWEQQNSIN